MTNLVTQIPEPYVPAPDSPWQEAKTLPMAVPHNREAEEAVIGSLFIDPDYIADVFDILSAPDFYITRLQWIYESMLRLWMDGMDIDLLTVSNDLEAHGQLGEVGGPAWLTSLVNQSPSSLNVLSYAKIVEDNSIRRRMIQQANDIATLAYDPTLDMDKIAVKFEGIVEQKPAPQNTTLESTDQAWGKLKEEIHSGKSMSIPTGLHIPDSKYGGYPRKMITMVIGDNSIGKSALLLQSCEALNYTRERSLYITLEEPTEGMVSRRVFPLANVPYLALRNGTLTEEQVAALDLEGEKYVQSHKYIKFDQTARTIRQISRSVKQWKPKLVVIDDLLHVYGAEYSGDNEASGLIRVVTKLKDIAIDNDCAVVILHHLTAEEAQKSWPGQKEKAHYNPPTQNLPPALDSMTWSKNLRFTVDLWLALVPDFKTDIKKDVVKLIQWVMKDKRGARLDAIELYYDKLDQWMYDNDSRGDMKHTLTTGSMPNVKPLPVGY